MVERNRQRQRIRDRKRRLCDLANNNSAPPWPPDRVLPTTTSWYGGVSRRIKEIAAMLSTEQINDLHRLYWSECWPIRKIERHLQMGWHTIRKYLDAPAQGPARRQRTSKLDAFKATIAEWLEKDATVSSTVIEQRLRPLGYTGGHSILREYLQKVRPLAKPARAFIRNAKFLRWEQRWTSGGPPSRSSSQFPPKRRPVRVMR
jgi:transposase